MSVSPKCLTTVRKTVGGGLIWLNGFYRTDLNTKSPISAYIGRAPVLKHRQDVAKLDLNGETCFPFWLHLNVLTNLSFDLLHSLKSGKKRVTKVTQLLEVFFRLILLTRTCMHLRNPRKTLKPSRNFPRNCSVHTVGLLMRMYLRKQTHTITCQCLFI